MPATPARLALALLAVTTITLACTGTSEEPATPTAIATPSPTATATPSPTPTPPPTPEPSPTPVPAVAPDVAAPGASVLWAATVQAPGIPWVSFRTTAGAAPASDPWLLEFGAVTPIRFNCWPTAVDDTIQLSGCSGANRASTFSATINPTSRQLTASFQEPAAFGSRFLDLTLTPVFEREEPPASDNVTLLWNHNAHASGSYTDIWVQDGVVFAPHFGGAIELLDAASGQLLSQFNAGSTVLDVKARDGILYAATTSLGILIYDVTDPTAPTHLGSYARWSEVAGENFFNIHNIFLGPTGNTIYAINDSHPRTDLRLIDVSDPTFPSESGRFTIEHARSTLEGAHDVNVIEYNGHLIAFLDALASGLYILDVTDPADIRVHSRTAWLDTFSHSGWPYEVDGRLIYVHADEGHDESLILFDVTSFVPKRLSQFQTRPGTSGHNIQVVGTTAFVAYYIDGLRVLDLSDPTDPREIAHFDTVASEDERDLVQGAWGIHVVDGIAYISDRETGIYALDVALP